MVSGENYLWMGVTIFASQKNVHLAPRENENTSNCLNCTEQITCVDSKWQTIEILKFELTEDK